MSYLVVQWMINWARRYHIIHYICILNQKGGRRSSLFKNERRAPWSIMNWKKNAVSLLTMSMIYSSSIMATGVQLKDIGSHWSKSTVEWGVQKGMVKGYPDGTFKPNNYVTEAEFLSLLIRAYAPADLQEINGSHWADSFYTYSSKMNYPTNGNRGGKITRAHVAEVIAGSQGLNLTGNNAIKYVLVNGIAKGKTLPSVEGYKGGDYLTRAEVVQFIKKVKDKGLDEVKARPITPTDITTLELQYQELLKQQKPVLDPEKQMEKARNKFSLEYGVTQEQVDKWTNVMYELGKKSGIVNGKIRVYLPQGIPDDFFVKLFVGNNISNRLEFGMPKGKEIPEYLEFDASENWSFYISLGKDINGSGLPVTSTNYDTWAKILFVNTVEIEENVNK